MEPVDDSLTCSYIVQLDDAPVAEYGGGIAGLPSTRVVPGGKLVKTASQVVGYVQHLARERQEILAKVPDVKKLYDYSYTYAGFSAHMSYDEAVKLAKSSGVKSVEPSELPAALACSLDRGPNSTAEIADNTPASTQICVDTFFTEMPASDAALGLSAEARTFNPNLVFVSRYARTAQTIGTTISTES